jgi:hypothetical protein
MTRARAVVLSLLIVAACDAGLQPTAAPTACPPGFVGVCGTVRLQGAIPESTDVVYVVAYATFPQSRADLFTFQPAAPATPPTLPLGDTTATYILPLPPGRYEWIVAVWKKVGILTPTSADSLLMESGYYRDPADTTLPGAVVVSGAVDSVDFVVDFDNRHPVAYWFPAVRR